MWWHLMFMSNKLQSFRNKMKLAKFQECDACEYTRWSFSISQLKFKMH